MKSIEKSGKTVDLAIEAALEELGLERDEVQVDIIQIESSGILGVFGKRDAKVRVIPLKALKEVEAVPEATRPPRQSPPRERERTTERTGDRSSDRSSGRQEKPRDRRRESQPPRRQPEPVRQSPPPPPPPAPKPIVEEEEFDDETPSEVSQKAAEVLSKIADSFGLEVTVNSNEDARAINLRVGGNDVGQLIGRRGRTLGAVQYVISRIINEDRASKKKINIDVDGYNENREKSVSEMAARAVDRVLQNGRPYSFRPMSPQDRRLIHVNLQDHPTIATQSVGEEPNRFVVVYPRSMNSHELDRYIADAASYSERRSRGPRGGNRDGGREGGRPPRGHGRGPVREGNRDGRESGPPRRRRLE